MPEYTKEEMEIIVDLFSRYFCLNNEQDMQLLKQFCYILKTYYRILEKSDKNVDGYFIPRVFNKRHHKSFLEFYEETIKEIKHNMKILINHNVTLLKKPAFCKKVNMTIKEFHEFEEIIAIQSIGLSISKHPNRKINKNTNYEQPKPKPC